MMRVLACGCVVFVAVFLLALVLWWGTEGQVVGATILGAIAGFVAASVMTVVEVFSSLDRQRRR